MQLFFKAFHFNAVKPVDKVNQSNISTA